MRKIAALIFVLSFSVIVFSSLTGITKEGYFFTRTKEQLEKLIDHSAKNDYDFLENYTEELISVGDGGMLKAGLEVYIEESSSDIVRFRVKGETDSFWTLKRAIKSK